MIDQPSMFDEYEGQIIEDKPEPEVKLIPRTPEWVLLARGKVVKGYHKVTATGPYAEQYAACGLIGRAVRDETGELIPACEKCQAITV